MKPATVKAPAKRARSERKSPPLRMKDLCEQTGLGRQAVHFYIQQGLLPEGQKTGRNMAYYSPAHVERLQLIRRLQEEHFLPLKAIRSVLDLYEDADAFSPPQRQLLEAVRQKLRPLLGATPTERLQPLAPLLVRHQLPQSDVEDLVSCGLLTLGHKSGEAAVRSSDVWLLETMGELRRIGLTRELGFTAREIGLVDELVTALFRKETALLSQRLAHLDPTTVATLVQQALPHMNTLLLRLHEAKLRDFIEQGQGAAAAPKARSKRC